MRPIVDRLMEVVTALPVRLFAQVAVVARRRALADRLPHRTSHLPRAALVAVSLAVDLAMRRSDPPREGSPGLDRS